jgi:hypothetical protein
MQSTQPLATNRISLSPSLPQTAKPIKCRHWPTSRVRGVITITMHDPPFVACGSLRVETTFEVITFTAYNPPLVPRPAYSSRSWLHNVGSPNKTPSTPHNHALTRAAGRKPPVPRIGPRLQCTPNPVRRTTTGESRAGGVSPPWLANASATGS